MAEYHSYLHCEVRLKILHWFNNIYNTGAYITLYKNNRKFLYFVLRERKEKNNIKSHVPSLTSERKCVSLK